MMRPSLSTGQSWMFRTKQAKKTKSMKPLIIRISHGRRDGCDFVVREEKEINT